MSLPELTENEYIELYHILSADDKYMHVENFSADGVVSFNCILFIPEKLSKKQKEELMIFLSDFNKVAEETNRKREEEAVKRGKKLPSYGTVYASTILYLSLGMYLIGLQTTIPSIKTRKTAPGCVRSFSGFPFEGEGDDSSINYVACVAIKSRDPTTIPWNVLPKNEEKIVTTLKSFIIRYLLPYGEVEQKIKDLEGVTTSKIELTFDPPWEKEMMSEVAQLELGFM